MKKLHVTTFGQDISKADSDLRRLRFVEYVSWCLHHGADHMVWEEWKAAWNAGVIR